ncbi:WXG100 family type VII secretion target [Actinokineospora iranica]|uniref:WXG100 family type VII secretion target n=1 Tax=Actinokineospora iranica TaxID=1271860 RepID=A0A1G6SUH2_9PSEU|nr:hypothetical protein [Actinokineospora iranica]SDD20580.1 hypothetical protein SAMN05216174_108188 [Actinokineospora iranica]
MTGYRVRAQRLADHAGQFDGLAEQVAAVHRELADRLAAAGQCWGADEIGLSFAATHTAPADSTLGGIEALPGRLGDVGGRFRSTAEAYLANEQGNSQIIGSVDA